MKRSSISRNLTVSILAAVMVVAIIGISVSYYMAIQRTDAALNEKADEYLAFIVNTVGEPLWYLNNRHLREIISYFENDENIRTLSIQDSAGKEVIAIDRNDPFPAITRESEIHYDGNFIGKVRVTLTSRYYRAINRQFLYSSLSIVMSILFILFVIIGLLLRRFLKRPINDITEIAQAYGSGDYDPPVRQEVDEFRIILSAFRQMGQEIRKQMFELREKERLAAIGELSGNISHEMKNSLGVIDSSVYYLKMKLKGEDEKVQVHLDRIKSAVKASDGIIKSLVDLTRSKALHLEKLNISGLVTDAAKAAHVPEGVNLIQTDPEEEVWIEGDVEGLTMAFRNIIDNAVRSMEGKGTLTVVVSARDSHGVTVTFSDTGPGISEEDLTRIFQPLFTTRAKGMGFGLSMTRMIVEKHHGTILATSVNGEGATFTVRLPDRVNPANKGESHP